MNLQTKAVISFNVFIILVCLCMGILGYRSADNGFGVSLQSKASSNVNSILEIMEFRYPGEWNIKDNLLIYYIEFIDIYLLFVEESYLNNLSYELTYHNKYLL